MTTAESSGPRAVSDHVEHTDLDISMNSLDQSFSFDDDHHLASSSSPILRHKSNGKRSRPRRYANESSDYLHSSFRWTENTGVYSPDNVVTHLHPMSNAKIDMHQPIQDDCLLSPVMSSLEVLPPPLPLASGAESSAATIPEDVDRLANSVVCLSDYEKHRFANSLSEMDDSLHLTRKSLHHWKSQWSCSRLNLDGL
jgi:hypothetical protein